MAGFEPTTSRLLSGCSTAKLHWLRHLIGVCVTVSTLKKSQQLKFRKTTPVGFEPTRAEPTGLAGRRLNHSAKVSLAEASKTVLIDIYASLFVMTGHFVFRHI